jgi:hypothetical protein
MDHAYLAQQQSATAYVRAGRDVPLPKLWNGTVDFDVIKRGCPVPMQWLQRAPTIGEVAEELGVAETDFAPELQGWRAPRERVRARCALPIWALRTAPHVPVPPRTHGAPFPLPPLLRRRVERGAERRRLC